MSREARNALWSIGKAAQTVTLSPSSVMVTAGQTETITASWLGDGVLSATSSDTTYATVSVSGNVITVTGVANGSANVTASVSAGSNYLAGNATSAVTVNAGDVGYLRFSSPNSFSMYTRNSVKNWDGTLEYRSGNGSWTTWDGSSISSDNGTIDLRGTGNSYISGTDYRKSFRFSGSNISCEGNIENLLDYQTVVSGQHPTMGMSCFMYLFYEASALISAPTLGAVTLSANCYNEMFAYCTGLTVAPDLPALTLANYCYTYMFSSCSALSQPPAILATAVGTNSCESMFHSCTSLVALPKLYAQTLGSDCYSTMFYGCSAIKLSTTQTGEYQYPYRIPNSGTGVTATNALRNMFQNTGGTFTGTPDINTTYYTDHEAV